MGVKAYEYSVDFEEHLVGGPSFQAWWVTPGDAKFMAENKLGVLSADGTHIDIYDDHGHKVTKEVKDLNVAQVRLFYCFYYIMTGIHGVHLVIGIGCVLWLVLEALRGNIPPQAYSTVEVISLYWHLVDMIWLFLMPLLYLVAPHSPLGHH
jgi:cytochrome c oxidase subunit 3